MQSNVLLILTVLYFYVSFEIWRFLGNNKLYKGFSSGKHIFQPELMIGTGCLMRVLWHGCMELAETKHNF